MTLAKDGGFASRKMIMTYVVMLLVLGGYAVTGIWPTLGVTFGEYCTGLIAAAGLYIGGNVGVKLLASKAVPPQDPPPPAA